MTLTVYTSKVSTKFDIKEKIPLKSITGIYIYIYTHDMYEKYHLSLELYTQLDLQ